MKIIITTLLGLALMLPVDKGIDVGKEAIDIQMVNVGGKSVSLKDFKGKLVLVDFWASWCRPCRIENPTVVKAYQTYKDKKFKNAKGFDIYSISLDRDSLKWLAAIAQDKLEWETHCMDNQKDPASPARVYNVEYIPTNVLIDGNGIIIGKNLRGEDLEKALAGQLK
jgi:thiol-disulfide isomerase/thioredoxin